MERRRAFSNADKENVEGSRIERATNLTQQRVSQVTHQSVGIGFARKERITPSVNRVGFRSPLFARRTIFLASNVAIAASRSATFNRFRASSNAALMAAMSSGPNAV